MPWVVILAPVLAACDSREVARVSDANVRFSWIGARNSAIVEGYCAWLTVSANVLMDVRIVAALVRACVRIAVSVYLRFGTVCMHPALVTWVRGIRSSESTRAKRFLRLRNGHAFHRRKALGGCSSACSQTGRIEPSKRIEGVPIKRMACV